MIATSWALACWMKVFVQICLSPGWRVPSIRISRTSIAIEISSGSIERSRGTQVVYLYVSAWNMPTDETDLHGRDEVESGYVVCVASVLKMGHFIGQVCDR